MESKLDHKYSVGEGVRFPDGSRIRKGKIKHVIFIKYREDSHDVYYRIKHHTKKVNEKHILPLEQE